MKFMSQVTGYIAAALLGGAVIGGATVYANSSQSSSNSLAMHGTHGVKVPAPAAVSVNPKNTALIILDDVEAVKTLAPNSITTFPVARKLLTEARDHGMYVIHTGFPAMKGLSGGNKFVKGLQANSGEPIILGFQDKFHQSASLKGEGAAGKSTELLQDLQSHHIQNIIIVGGGAAGGVQYTTFEAMNDGFRVILPEDGIYHVSKFNELATYNNLLNQAIIGNPKNNPQVGNIVLTTSNKLTFQSK